MTRNMIHLLRTRRFLPLFLTQFLGALNDNFFKNALVILVLYRIAELAGLDGPLLVTAAAGLFILPFFLFSATAGQIADKFEKADLIRIVKACEVIIMGLGAWGLFQSDVTFLLGVLFLMGTQSAFFGPIKYSILPAHLDENELIAGNGLIGAATFLAILIGTIAGGLLVLGESGIPAVGSGIVGLAAAGLLASFYIPRAPAPSPELRVNPNVLGEAWAMIGRIRASRTLFLTVLGTSWFWLVGAMFLAEFPAFAKDVLGANEQVVTLFLTVFSVGIGIGALLCNRLLKGEITAKYVPFGALGMTLFILDLYAASPASPPAGPELIDAAAFLGAAANWRILIDLLGIAVTAGLYIVPLLAILQARSDPESRSRVIAGNNIMNALFMVAGVAAASALLALGFTVPEIFLICGIASGLVAVYICGLLPDALVRAFFAGLLKLFYRVEVRGLEHIEGIGDRAVIVANHVSFLDGILLASFLPNKPVFAVDTFIAKRWWVRPFLALADTFTVDPTNPMATKSLIKKVEEGRHCVIFPEGRLTVTGALMKVYEGPGMVADKADAPLVPVRIDGAQFTPFSRLRGKVRLRLFPRITITIQPPRRFEIPPDVKGRARRQMAALKLYDVMSELIYETCDKDRTLFESLLEARAIHGGRSVVFEDVERRPITYNKLIRSAVVLGRKIAGLSEPGETVGLMLPNSVGAAVTFFACQVFGRVPAMLNFSTGTGNMVSAIETARVKTVFTSRRFVEMAKLDAAMEALGKRADIVFLEDLRRRINPFDRLVGLVAVRLAGWLHRRRKQASRDPAVVLFTSGSEGAPKGVVLSHRNLLANRYQLAARIDFNPTDIVFNALPIFHSFGLTGGLLLPVLAGVRTFLYPSPLHYRVVPALAYDTNATILFGTDTFLAGYARMAHPYDFYSVRYVFAGAEKVRDETRRIWTDTFGLRLLEGYGATETAPVIAVNTPMHFKAGSVGRFLPGVDCRLEPVPGIDEGSRLMVSGANVMLGYLLNDRPGELQPPGDEGWYDTGDIVTVDGAGFVTIAGRAKRFAKIAGEMVSLGAVEEAAGDLWPEHAHAAIVVPDPRKGEQIILATDRRGADRDALVQHARGNGMAEIMVPREVRVVDEVPLLATGKVDYPKVEEMVSGNVPT